MVYTPHNWEICFVFVSCQRNMIVIPLMSTPQPRIPGARVVSFRSFRFVSPYLRIKSLQGARLTLRVEVEGRPFYSRLKI